MTTQATTLPDFLERRLAEDEAAARDRIEDGMDRGWPSAARVLAEVEAKRRIVEDHRTLDADYRVTRDPVTEARRFQALVAVGQLATAYADHPEFDEAWAP